MAKCGVSLNQEMNTLFWVNTAKEKKIRLAYHAGAFLGESILHSFVVLRGFRGAIAHTYLMLGFIWAKSVAGQPHFLGTRKEDRLSIADYKLFNQLPIEPIADGLQASSRRMLKPRIQHSMRIDKIWRGL